MSFLASVGKVLRTILHIGEEAAVVATPIISAFFPEVAPLYTSALGLAIGAETTIGSVSGSGTQKLAATLTTLVPQAQAWAKQNNITWPDADIQKWASAVVDTLNMIPAPAPKV